VVEAALWSGEGEAVLTQPTEATTSATLLDPGGHSLPSWKVRTVRLDQLPIIGRKVLVKLDLQGAEVEALAGLEGAWDRVEGLILEVGLGQGESYYELRKIMEAKGFVEAATFNELDAAGKAIEADKLWIRHSPALEAGVPGSRRNTWLVQVAGALAVSAIALWLTFRRVSMADFMQIIRAADLQELVPYLALFVLIQLFRALRWRLLLDPVAKLGFARVNEANAVGLMVMTILPLRIGEIARPIADRDAAATHDRPRPSLGRHRTRCGRRSHGAASAHRSPLPARSL